MRSAVARLDRARLPKNGLYAEPCRWGNTPGLAVVGARVGALDKHGAQHLDAGPGAPGAAFAGALVVAGAQAGPGGEAPGVAEHARVGSDLAQDGASRRVVATGDGLQQAERLGVGRERLVELPVELLRAPADGGRVRSAGSASRMRSVSRSAELRASPSRSSWGRRGGGRGQDVGTVKPVDQAVEDAPAVLAEDVGQQRSDADAAAVDHLLRLVAPGEQLPPNGRSGIAGRGAARGERSSPARTRTGAPAPGGGCPRYRSSVRRNCSTAAAGTANFMLRGGHAPRGHDGLDSIRRESGGGGF